MPEMSACVVELYLTGALLLRRFGLLFFVFVVMVSLVSLLVGFVCSVGKGIEMNTNEPNVYSDNT
jgi:hypothetical protein